MMRAQIMNRFVAAVCVSIIICLLPVPSVAEVKISKTEQDASDKARLGRFITDGMFNGHYWKDLLDESEKEAYIFGVHNAARIYAQLATEAEGPASKDAHDQLEYKFKENKTSNQDLVKEIDHLYADPANANLPIPLICILAADIFKGAEPDTVQHQLSTWRKRYS